MAVISASGNFTKIWPHYTLNLDFLLFSQNHIFLKGETFLKKTWHVVQT